MKTLLKKQRGFALSGLLVAMVIATLLATFAGSEIVRRNNDATAEATGRYLMAVRDAVIAFQVKHEAWLTKVDTSGAPAGIYPPAPALTFVASGGGQERANADIALLRNENLLPADFRDTMPYGERARLLFVRSGTCPGAACNVQVFVYSCHPISRHRSTRNAASSCTSVPAGRNRADPSLVAKVLTSADGYGGHDLLGAGEFQGPLVNAQRAWFPISEHRGRVVIAAGLNATPFAQFVRQGDTRHIFLRNDLTVDGVITTNTGLLFGRTVTFGSSCTRENMYAPTSNGVLAVCKGGRWQLQPDYSVVFHREGLRHNDAIDPAPTCPAGSTDYRMIALQSIDMRVSQTSGMNVSGSLDGNVRGTGTVNASGNVTVTGTFSGSFVASGSSYVEMGQTASINGNRVFISPNRAGARATVIQGCRPL